MIQLNEKGLVPAIAQNADTGEVIMLGYMSPSALKRTLDEGEVWFYSRSRSDLWHKGEVSGKGPALVRAELQDSSALLEEGRARYEQASRALADADASRRFG